jgi:hypothetical protein
MGVHDFIPPASEDVGGRIKSGHGVYGERGHRQFSD